MKTKTFIWVIGAAIFMFVISGTALADGKRGAPNGSGGKGYHSGGGNHQGPQFKHRGPARKFQRYQHRRPFNHRGPDRRFGRYQPRPHPSQRHFNHRPHYRPAPRPHYRHYPPATRPHYGHRPRYRSADAFYGFSLSILDPYFSLGFSTGGRW
jgi:hypothetical protein